MLFTGIPLVLAIALIYVGQHSASDGPTWLGFLCLGWATFAFIITLIDKFIFQPALRAETRRWETNQSEQDHEDDESDLRRIFGS